MSRESEKSTSLPRCCIISSGREKTGEDSSLLRLMENLPVSLPCMVQIREKHLDAKSLYELSCRAAIMKRLSGTLVLLNERADIAMAAGLDGVHLPEIACHPAALKAAGLDMLYGCSVHSIESAHAAENNGAAYLLFGPVFDTPSKRSYGAPQGLGKLETLCRSTTLPVFAIGGVTPENAPLCRETGAWGCAALSLFLDISSLALSIEQMNHPWRNQ